MRSAVDFAEPVMSLASVDADLCIADNLLPLVGFRLEERGELLRRTGGRFEADRGETVLDVGLPHDFGDAVVEQIDDCRRGTSRRHDAGPELTSWPVIPCSSSVGTSGTAGERLCAATTRPRSLPSFMSGATAVTVIGTICVCPATVDCTAGTGPWNGTLRTSKP